MPPIRSPGTRPKAFVGTLLGTPVGVRISILVSVVVMESSLGVLGSGASTGHGTVHLPGAAGAASPA